MNRLHRPAAVLLMLCVATAAAAQSGLPAGDPQSLGFSPDRLARIAPWYQSKVDADAVTGAVVAIARDGKLAYLQAIGFQDRAKKVPMRTDSIFWLASMTKPVTSVAAMMLVEQGRLDLAAPVGQYLPELKDLLVGVEEVGRDGKAGLVLEPAKRPMTVADLLQFTSGLVLPLHGSGPVHKLNSRRLARPDQTLAEFVTGLSKLPLAYQPGEVWEYSDWSMDVLARVVEVASAAPFDRFVEDRMLGPLHMTDTVFYLPQDKRARLADPIAAGQVALFDATRQRKFLSGAGGLVSTAPDYLRFCQMLLNGGELDGVRLLAPATVKQMTTDTLTPTIRIAGVDAAGIGGRSGTGWGLGLGVRTGAQSSTTPGAVGSFSWNGHWGTYFWVDPAERMIVVQMIQVPHDRYQEYFDAIRHLAYAALAVPEAGSAGAEPPLVTVDTQVLSTYAGRYYFGPSLSASDRRSQPDGVFGGVGLNVAKVGGLAEVTPIAGRAAARAGVQEGDVLVQVDAWPVAGLDVGQIIDKIRGPVGSRTTLTLRRAGHEEPLAVTIDRETLNAPGAEISVQLDDGKLVVEATGAWPVFEIEKHRPMALHAMSNSEFYVEGKDRTRIAFVRNEFGKVSGAVLNPGPGAVTGMKVG
jgi:CubicO group peptidase (beta-lactamase class C family)